MVIFLLMAGSNLFFTSFRSSFSNPFPARFRKLLEKTAFENTFKKNEFLGVKTHFGEIGNTGFIQPAYVRQLLEYYRKMPVRIFITDTNTIYQGSRSDAVSHLHNAYANGFSYATLGVPVIIADGLTGQDFIEVPVDGEVFTKVKIAGTIGELDKMVVLSHVKGHMIGGFGGALKNLGMGCAPRLQKYAMHSTMNPFVIREKCAGCGKCAAWCPEEAISLRDKKAFLDDKKCAGCGECIEVCPENAIDLNWNAEAHRVQKAWVETACGVVKKVKPENILYVNFINNVTPDCDCFGFSDNAIVRDVGVLAGTDPVAIDRASVDLINRQEGLAGSRLKKALQPGSDKFRDIFPQVDWKVQLDHAEKLGMGKQDYEIIEIK